MKQILIIIMISLGFQTYANNNSEKSLLRDLLPALHKCPQSIKLVSNSIKTKLLSMIKSGQVVEDISNDMLMLFNFVAKENPHFADFVVENMELITSLKGKNSVPLISALFQSLVTHKELNVLETDALFLSLFKRLSIIKDDKLNQWAKDAITHVTKLMQTVVTKYPERIDSLIELVQKNKPSDPVRINLEATFFIAKFSKVEKFTPLFISLLEDFLDARKILTIDNLHGLLSVIERSVPFLSKSQKTEIVPIHAQLNYELEGRDFSLWASGTGHSID